MRGVTSSIGGLGRQKNRQRSLPARSRHNAVITDVRLPGAMDSIDLAWEVKLRWPHTGIVFHGCPPSPDAWGRLTSEPRFIIYRGQPPSPLARSEAHYGI
jgi:hypothetical protein